MDVASDRSFTEIRSRLEEIASQVRGDDIALDKALDLYDEAVKLGMKATELLEVIEEDDFWKRRQTGIACGCDSYRTRLITRNKGKVYGAPYS